MKGSTPESINCGACSSKRMDRLTASELFIIIIFIRTRSTQHEQIIQKIDGTVQQILKVKGE